MILRNELLHYLNEYLAIADFNDYGPQGLQVEGREEIEKIATGVSLNVQLLERAAAVDADTIIVHHGLLWDKESHVVKGSFKKRLKLLLQNDMNLFAYHLPLDKHPVVGNNAMAANAFGLKEIKSFGQVGVQGAIELCGFEELLHKIQQFYQTDPLVFPFGPSKINRIAISSGASQRDITLAIESGLDAFITGEVSEAVMHLAREGHIHFFAAGHYATEKPGITALGEHIASRFPVQVTFVDVPNPV